MDIKDQFLAKLADILEIEKVEESAVLNSFEQWDSLSVLTVIATADSNYGVSLSAADVKRAHTAGDLAALISAKKRG